MSILTLLRASALSLSAVRCERQSYSERDSEDWQEEKGMIGINPEELFRTQYQPTAGWSEGLKFAW
jgi:hypothetical protein